MLRKHIADESVDLIYLDPPFNSNADYNALFRTPKGQVPPAQQEAFTVTVRPNRSALGRCIEDSVHHRIVDTIEAAGDDAEEATGLV